MPFGSICPRFRERLKPLSAANNTQPVEEFSEKVDEAEKSKKRERKIWRNSPPTKWPGDFSDQQNEKLNAKCKKHKEIKE